MVHRGHRPRHRSLGRQKGGDASSRAKVNRFRRWRRGALAVPELRLMPRITPIVRNLPCQRGRDPGAKIRTRASGQSSATMADSGKPSMGELSAIIGMLSAMDWNDCPQSIGIPVRNRRNPHDSFRKLNDLT